MPQKRPHGIGKWLASRHCKDLKASLSLAIGLSLAVVVLASVFAVLPLIASALPSLGLNPKTVVRLDVTPFVQLMAALVAANVGYFQFVASSANARAGVAAVLEGEIRSIANAVDRFRIIELLAAGLNGQDPQAPVFGDIQRIMGATGEQYMQAYEKNLEKIANLSEDAVMSVTSFYTYLKASRDASRAIGQWVSETPLDTRKSDMIKVLQLLHASFEHGQNAIELLSELGTRDFAISDALTRISRLVGTSKDSSGRDVSNQSR